MDQKKGRVPQVQLCISAEPAAAAGTMLADWFTRGLSEVGGPLAQLMVGGGDASHQPNAVTGSMHIEGARTATMPWSQSAWAQMLGFLRDVPRYVALEIAVRDGEQQLLRPGMSITSERFDGVGNGWLLLTLDRADAALMDTDDGEQVLADFLRSFAEASDPGHGEISFSWTIAWAALEQALHLWPKDTVPRCREILRSYSWVTVLPRELGERLGGLPTLQASGAFSEVAQLGYGGFWLRATPHWRDYGAAEAKRVFGVLAPVLPAGASNG